MPLALEFEAVEFAYSHGPPVLREVDLGVRAGEFLAIAGPNGGGKTTLLRLALIAKAPVADPKLLALDEPTSGVDVEAQDALAELLARLHDDLGVTILYVSHEFGAIEHVVERLVLVRERIVFDGPPSSLPGVWHDPSHVHV